MSCEELRAMFSQYLDGELPRASCEQIERHAEECSPCAGFLSSVKRTVSLCRDLKSGEPPRPLAPEARSKLRELYERRFSGSPGEGSGSRRS